MLSPELLKKVEHLLIRSRHRVTDVFVGEYESAFRGRGIEFEEFRDYVPGDDVRQIDWNVTARMDKPFVKIFREEREQTLFFLVDVSRSLDFGGKRSKRDIASEIAALLAYAASRSNDKIGLVIFSDHIEKYIPPKKGRSHVWNIVATILSHKPTGRKTDIRGALQFFLRVAHRRATCFLLSDFFDADYEKSLNVARIRHDFVVIRILDPLERELPKGAIMEFEDLEQGGVQAVDLGTGRVQREYRDRQARQREALARFLSGYRIDFLDLSVSEDHVEALLRFFTWREKKR